MSVILKKGEAAYTSPATKLTAYVAYEKTDCICDYKKRETKL